MASRRAAKVDENQRQIVEALRSVGATVHVTSAVGAGFPDLVVGLFGRNYLLEVKDGDKSPSRQALTGEQAIFHNEWKGQCAIVNSVESALQAIGAQMQ